MASASPLIPGTNNVGQALATAAVHMRGSGAGGGDVLADKNTLSWVNTLLGSIWPKANDALSKYVHDELTPALQSALPAPLRGLRFERFTLGRNAPEFGPIEVHRHSESHVQVELHMRYFGDVDILCAAGGGITFGVSQLTFVGRLCIALKPLLSTSPVIGGVHVFFATPPRVDMRFTGMGLAVNEVPGLVPKFTAAIDDFFRNSMVLPNMKSMHLTRDEGIMDLTAAASHPPLGVLRVRVKRARGLPGANFQLGLVERFTSDPYCILRLGQSTVRTSTVRGSTDPDWPDAEPSAYFVVHHRDQELDIGVFQEEGGGLLRRNLVGTVGSLGRMPATTIRALFQQAALAQASTSQGSKGAFAPPARSVAGEHQAAADELSVALDSSSVNRSVLHVDDPVHRGVPSELTFELDWFNLEATPSSPSQPPRENVRSKPLRYDSGVDDALAVGHGPVSALLVELHAGSGFPEESASAKRRLRWQCRIGDLTSSRSKPGEFFVDQPHYNLPIHPKLFHVIDQLAERRVPVEEIADVCDLSPELVETYITQRMEYEQRLDARFRETGEELCVEARWHETLSIVLKRPAEAHLILELVEGDSKVVGYLDPIAMRQLMLDGGVLSRTTFKLTPAEREVAKTGGFMSSWLAPCNKPLTAARAKYRLVRMEVSVRLHSLIRGCGADVVGSHGSCVPESDRVPKEVSLAPPRPREPGLAASAASAPARAPSSAATAQPAAAVATPLDAPAVQPPRAHEALAPPAPPPPRFLGDEGCGEPSAADSQVSARGLGPAQVPPPPPRRDSRDRPESQSFDLQARGRGQREAPPPPPPPRAPERQSFPA
eukprot:TRINITY_DN64549_c0_g1_i1.p1 TRINITY_DN64549_c0_g1~~TRINITY_DN64549_c0_g1_i1.p1  ORF type:complete len:831 (+),score=128.83 TRINITY_DN64549_c0_g1_i1:81-2573(+)